MEDKKQLDPAVKAFFQDIGKRNGDKLFKERGSEYFSNISKQRKTYGKQKVKPV